MLSRNKDFKDLDIIYNGDINLFIDELKNKGYNIFTLKEDMGIYRAQIHEKILDIAVMKEESIEKDLEKRDFTINAVALKLVDNIIVDPFKGRSHIKARLIHEVSENSIKNDRVRILRAYRFAIKYGMHFSKSCEEHILEESKYIKESPKERIFNEFIEIIKEDKIGIAFNDLDKYGVLKNLLPYIDELKTVGKCRYHIEDAFTHMNLAYSNSKGLLNKTLNIKGLDLNIFNTKIGDIPISIYFSFVAFCHDIGKAKCYSETDDKASFIGHDREGARIMKEVCLKLNFPKKAERFIVTLIEAHMYPLTLWKNNIKNYKKSFYKFFSKYNKYIPYILALSYCDMHATKMLYDINNEEGDFKGYIERLIEEYEIYKKIKETKLISGSDIIEVAHAKGEEIKSIIDEIYKKVYYGEIYSREEALEYLKKYKKIY